MNKKQPVILVMDWLDAYAGSEQVVKYLHEVYQFDKVYALTHIMPAKNLARIFGKNIPKIQTSPLQFLGKRFRFALPLFPFFLRKLKVTEENALIISVTHSVVKGIDFPASSKHLSYLVARNLKYVWEEQALYFKGIRKVFTGIIPSLQRFDVQMSKRPTKLMAVSTFVAAWATEKYGRSVAVVNPPVNISDFEFEAKKEDFYVSVGRLEPYKRYDLLIDTFNENGKKLVIIGDGSLEKELRAKAKENIQFTGYLFPEASKNYLKNAKAFVFCGKEDFGIALLEPQVCGTPVIAYKAGGALDTVVENTTGVFFEKQSIRSLTAAITLFETRVFDPHKIRAHATQFSVAQFKEQFKAQVATI